MWCALSTSNTRELEQATLEVLAMQWGHVPTVVDSARLGPFWSPH
jgi:hypothetical protein